MSSQLVMSLVVAAFVGGTAAYLGSLMITRQMALVGDALGHVALPGMGLAILAKVDPSLGALLFLLVAILLLWKLEERTPLSSETLVGILFVSSLAIGFLIVPQPELLESLIGDISKLTPGATILSVVVSVGVTVLVQRIYKGMMLLNISADLAAVQGIRERRYSLLYLLSIALIVSVGVKVTGSLLVGALVIIPPAVGKMVSTDLKHYAVTSIAAGVGSSLIGILIAEATGFPPGPAIILVSACLFLISMILGARLRSSPSRSRR